MRRISLKIAIGICAFVVGVVGVAFWFFEPLSLNQVSEVEPPVIIKAESTEEYDIYSLVLNELFLKEGRSIEPLTISNQTSHYNSAEVWGKLTPLEERVSHWKKYYPSVAEETLFDYEIKQEQTFKIYPKFDLPVEYQLVDAEKLSKGDGFAASLLIRLSRVGFNRDRNQAFLYVEFFCPLCGQSNHLLLQKENGQWKIKEDFGGWAS